MRNLGALETRTVYRGTEGDGDVFIAGQKGLLRFSESGNIVKVISEENASIDAGVAASFIGAVFGVDELAAGETAFFEAVTTYANCIRRKGAKGCAHLPGEFKTAEIDSIISHAKWIWAKVDHFLEAARKADANDSDLEVLEKIVLQYAASRPIVQPASVEDAANLLATSQKMLSEFESSPALGAFIFDEGECTEKRTGPRTHITTCTIGGYSHSAEGKDPEEPKDKDNPGEIMREMREMWRK